MSQKEASQDERAKKNFFSKEEKKKEKLSPVQGKVHPAAALLHAERAPLLFRKQASLGSQLREQEVSASEGKNSKKDAPRCL